MLNKKKKLRVKPKQPNYFFNVCHQQRNAKGQLSPQRRLNLNLAACSSGRVMSDGGKAKCQALPGAKCQGRHENLHPGAAFLPRHKRAPKHRLQLGLFLGIPNRQPSEHTSKKIRRHLSLNPTKQSGTLAAANQQGARRESSTPLRSSRRGLNSTLLGRMKLLVLLL